MSQNALKITMRRYNAFKTYTCLMCHVNNVTKVGIEHFLVQLLLILSMKLLKLN